MNESITWLVPGVKPIYITLVNIPVYNFGHSVYFQFRERTKLKKSNKLEIQNPQTWKNLPLPPNHEKKPIISPQKQNKTPHIFREIINVVLRIAARAHHMNNKN